MIVKFALIQGLDEKWITIYCFGNTQHGLSSFSKGKINQIRAISCTDFTGGGVYGEDFVTLNPNGTLTDLGFISGTDAANSALS